MKLTLLLTLLATACGGSDKAAAPSCVADGPHEFTATRGAFNDRAPCSTMPATFTVTGTLHGSEWDVVENGLHYVGSVGPACAPLSMFTDSSGFIHATYLGGDQPKLYVFKPVECTVEYFLR